MFSGGKNPATGHTERLISVWNAFLPPATKFWQGYIFTGVCDSVHGGGVGIPACTEADPPGSRHPPGPDTPPRPDPPGADTPRTRHPPGSRAFYEIRSMRGRYASYWNAILFEK